MKLSFSLLRLCFLSILMCSQAALSQNIEVLSISEGDIIEESFKTTCYDSNGNVCAVVHVVGLESTGFHFEGNIVRIVPSYKEYYLYVPSGTRRIRVKHHDYWPIEIDFRNHGVIIKGGKNYKVELKTTLSSGQEINNPEVTKKTALSVSTKPYGSIIMLDGDIIGTTPLLKDKIKAGSHHVHISYTDYEGYDTIITVEKGVLSQVGGLLAPIVDVVFKSNAFSATVWENGVKIGKTNEPIKLVAGSHIVNFTSKGYYGAVDTFFVSPANKSFDIYQPKKYIGSFNLKLKQMTLPMTVTQDSVHGDYFFYDLSPHLVNMSSFERKLGIDVNNRYRPSTEIALSLMTDYPVYYDNRKLVIRDIGRKVLELEPLSTTDTPSHKIYLSGIQSFSDKAYFEAYRRFRRAWEVAGDEHPNEVLCAMNWICEDAFLNIKDEDTAKNYEAMANLGARNALFVMGWLYENGLFVQKDFWKARELYLKSALAGNLSAVWSLAWFYERGIACERNLEMAYYLYNYSQEKMSYNNRSNSVAHFAIENQIVNNYSRNELYARGISGKEDRKKSYLRQAAIMGSEKAMMALGEDFWTETAAYHDNVDARIQTAKKYVSSLDIVKKLLENLTDKGKACEILGFAYGLNKLHLLA